MGLPTAITYSADIYHRKWTHE